MATNEGVINRSSHDESYIADADPQNNSEPPTDGGYLCSDSISTYYIFNTYEYDSISTWYNIDDTKQLDKLRELKIMILDILTLIQGKTHCGRALIAYPISHVVTEVDANLE